MNFTRGFAAREFLNMAARSRIPPATQVISNSECNFGRNLAAHGFADISRYKNCCLQCYMLHVCVVLCGPDSHQFRVHLTNISLKMSISAMQLNGTFSRTFIFIKNTKLFSFEWLRISDKRWVRQSDQRLFCQKMIPWMPKKSGNGAKSKSSVETQC